MAANRNAGRQPDAPSPLISGMRPVGMKRTALLLAAVAALWAAPAHAQTDFLTLQENVDASGTALMCPTRADNYVDCADAGTLPVPSMRGRAAAPGQARLATAHHGHDRHEARRRGWQDHLYLRAHGEGQHRGRITPAVGTRGGIIYPNTGRPTPPNGLDRYPPGSIASPAEACAAAVSVCWRNCAEHSDAATMTDCYLR